VIKVSCSRLGFTDKPAGIRTGPDRIVKRDCWKQRENILKGFLVLTSRSKNKWFLSYFSIQLFVKDQSKHLFVMAKSCKPVLVFNFFVKYTVGRNTIIIKYLFISICHIMCVCTSLCVCIIECLTINISLAVLYVL